MKLLDIFGTTSETFSLGSGEKKIELRTIDGILYFRNFGTGWQKASSESLREALRLRTWVPGILIGENEIFLYNNSIWLSETNITTNIFESDAKSFIKIADAFNFYKIFISTLTINDSISLTTDVSDSIFFDGTSGLDYIKVILPDAQTMHIGRQLLFINNTLTPIRVYKKDQPLTYNTVDSLQSLGLILISNDNSTGSWSTLSFSGSSGGGGTSLQIDETININDYNPPINPFVVGDLVWYNPVDKFWQKAYSENFDTDLFGIITNLSGTKLRIAVSGKIVFDTVIQTYNNNPIEEGKIYYLSDSSNPGKFTDQSGTINKKIFLGLSSNTIYIFNQKDYERFNEKKIYELINGASVNLNEGFSYKLDGFIQDDPNLTTFNGYIYQATPVEALIESSSDVVFDSDSPNGLCFFMDGNNLKMKNNLGLTKKIIIYRKKIK